MADSSDNNVRVGDSSMIELTGKIMVVALILLLFVVVFVLCLHFYAKWFWYRRHENNAATTRRRRRRLDFAAGHEEIVVSVLRNGLDPSILKTLPVVVFDPKEFKDGLECSVCLSDLSEGEKARLLPKCNHGFHVECIDMWFQSHSTCPLCRNPIANPSQSESTLETILEAPVLMWENPITEAAAAAFPTNVLFWGNETQVSTAEPSSSSSSLMTTAAASTSNSPDEVLGIDIPRPNSDEDEEQKSMVPTRFGTLKRLLSGNRRVNPSSPRSLDLELGGRGQT